MLIPLSHFIKKLPGINSAPDRFKFVLLCAAFSFVFLILFKPFGLIKTEPVQRLVIIAGFSAIYFTLFFVTMALSSIANNKRPLSGKVLIAANLIATVLIGIVVNFWFAVMKDFAISFSTLAKFIFYTILVHALVCGLTIFYYYVKQTLKKDTEPFSDPERSSQDINIPVNSQDILFIKAEDNYVSIFFEGKEKIESVLVRKTIKECYAAYGSQTLFHCHRSYLINPKRIKKVTGNAKKYRAILKNFDEEIPVSRNMGPKLQELVGKL